MNNTYGTFIQKLERESQISLDIAPAMEEDVVRPIMQYQLTVSEEQDPRNQEHDPRVATRAKMEVSSDLVEMP